MDSAAHKSKLTFRLTQVPDDTPEDAVFYIAGDLSGWRPKWPEGAMKREKNGTHSVTFYPNLGASRIRYRVTRGDWQNEETRTDGVTVERSISLTTKDTLVEIEVASWRDFFQVPHTVTGHLAVDEIELSALKRRRIIRVLLPSDYHDSTESYPVIYMQDGQNLFDEATAFADEWQVDETLETLRQDKGFPPVIVVGIDNGGEHRLDEYCPWRFITQDHKGGGLGQDYAYFLSHQLKPYIDKRFRTLPSREHTSVAGSSLGGLISLFTLLEYSGTFSRAAVLSPTVNVRIHGNRLRDYVKRVRPSHAVRIYLDMGDREASEEELEEVAHLADLMVGNELGDLWFRIIPGGEHSEVSWGSRLGEILQWLHA